MKIELVGTNLITSSGRAAYGHALLGRAQPSLPIKYVSDVFDQMHSYQLVMNQNLETWCHNEGFHEEMLYKSY